MSFVFILHDVNESIPKEVQRLRNTANAVNELLPVLTRIAEDMMRIEEAVFSSGGRRGGGSWKRLKPETIKRKGGNTQILVETGELKRSLTEPGANFQILNFGNGNQIEFGTDHPYALFHDQGTVGGIPARPLIKLMPSDPVRWGRMITDYIVRHHNV